VKWTTTERRHVSRVYRRGLKVPPDRGHAFHHPYGRSRKVDEDGRSCEEIDTTSDTALGKRDITAGWTLTDIMVSWGW
jgi:hypothetical protein